MNKRKLTTILTMIDIIGIIAIVICFLYRFTLVISFQPNVRLGGAGQFVTYSFFDGFIKINLILFVVLSIVLLILKYKKTGEINPKINTALIVWLVSFLVINTVHIFFYDSQFYTKREISGTIDDDFKPVPVEYEKYCPYFDKMDEITELDVVYECIVGETPIGKYISMETWCYDMGINFEYEEIQTKSSLLVNQFITTKGKPNWINENDETVYMESVQNNKYNCSVYRHKDFYEIWFVEKNNCVIIRYEKFGEFFDMSEDDILKDARYLYDTLKQSG